MSKLKKPREAENAVKAAILALFGREKIDRIVVFPQDDHLGEPGLSVTVFLKSAQKRISGKQLLDAIAAAATALRELEDYRFPYVTFISPEDEAAEDTRPAA